MENVKDRHVVVVSVDALVFEDIEILSKLSAFSAIWPQTARVNRVRSIYPTITYPCHSTMQTGVYPDRHGIVANERQIPCEKTSLWQHERSAIKAKTIFDYAKEKGLSTAAVSWPVTGHDPSIDYLINEYWPQRPDESTYDCFVNSGSSPEVMEKIVAPNLWHVENRNRMHPWADAFVFSCASAIIREFKPNLLLVHPANVDGYRHQSGVFSEKVKESLYDTNLWMTELFKAAQDAGIYNDTDFFIVSDHGQLDVCRSVAINVKLAENGLIDVDKDGRITDWRAFAKSGGLSANVYLKNPENKADWEATKKVLDALKDEEVYGISRVFTTEEVQKEERLSGDFSFVIETDDFTTFSSDWVRPLVKPLANEDYRFGRATHGHLPSKGPQPTLFAFGPHVNAGTVLENARLVDEAPTIAKIFGIEMKDVDGRSLNELLKL